MSCLCRPDTPCDLVLQLPSSFCRYNRGDEEDPSLTVLKLKLTVSKERKKKKGTEALMHVLSVHLCVQFISVMNPSL